MKQVVFIFFLFLSQALSGFINLEQDEIDSFGNKTEIIRNENGNITEVIYPPVYTVVGLDERTVVQFHETCIYDEMGRLIEYRDANDDATVAEYDEFNIPSKMYYADGTFETAQFDPTVGSFTSSVDRYGTLREFIRSPKGGAPTVRVTDRFGNVQEISPKNLRMEDGRSIVHESNEYPSDSIDSYTVNELGQTVRQIQTIDDTGSSFYTFNAMGRLDTKLMIDPQGNVLSTETFYYDGNGNCLYWKKEAVDETSTVRNYFGPCGRIEKSIENFGTPNETIAHYDYNEYGEPVWTDSSKTEEEMRTPVTEHSTPKPEGTVENLKRSVQHFFDSISDVFAQIPATAQAFVEWLQTPNPHDPDIREEISWVRWTLNHLMEWKEENRIGIIGKGELGNHVRITYLNGMRNTPEEVLEYLENLSKMHGNANVHYVFRESDGWFKDILKASLVVKGYYVTEHAAQLVDVWKEMIEEMGGVDGGGTIIHYAHSLGAADTYVAGGLLSEEERKMIKVYTFGSPQIIPSGYFGETVNYISRWDGVCLLGPYNYIKALFFEEEHVVHLKSWENMFLQDHLISYPTYNRVMMKLSGGIVTHFGPLVLDNEE
jgi:hypothetical protein